MSKACLFLAVGTAAASTDSSLPRRCHCARRGVFCQGRGARPFHVVARQRGAGRRRGARGAGRRPAPGRPPLPAATRSPLPAPAGDRTCRVLVLCLAFSPRPNRPSTPGERARGRRPDASARLCPLQLPTLPNLGAGRAPSLWLTRLGASGAARCRGLGGVQPARATKMGAARRRAAVAALLAALACAAQPVWARATAARSSGSRDAGLGLGLDAGASSGSPPPARAVPWRPPESGLPPLCGQGEGMCPPGLCCRRGWRIGGALAGRRGGRTDRKRASAQPATAPLPSNLSQLGRLVSGHARRLRSHLPAPAQRAGVAVRVGRAPAPATRPRHPAARRAGGRVRCVRGDVPQGPVLHPAG